LSKKSDPVIKKKVSVDTPKIQALKVVNPTAVSTVVISEDIANEIAEFNIEWQKKSEPTSSPYHIKNVSKLLNLD
jgi:hypothetical protein